MTEIEDNLLPINESTQGKAHILHGLGEIGEKVAGSDKYKSFELGLSPRLLIEDYPFNARAALRIRTS